MTRGRGQDRDPGVNNSELTKLGAGKPRAEKGSVDPPLQLNIRPLPKQAGKCAAAKRPKKRRRFEQTKLLDSPSDSSGDPDSDFQRPIPNRRQDEQMATKKASKGKVSASAAKESAMVGQAGRTSSRPASAGAKRVPTKRAGSTKGWVGTGKNNPTTKRNAAQAEDESDSGSATQPVPLGNHRSGKASNRRDLGSRVLDGRSGRGSSGGLARSTVFDLQNREIGIEEGDELPLPPAPTYRIPRHGDDSVFTGDAGDARTAAGAGERRTPRKRTAVDSYDDGYNNRDIKDGVSPARRKVSRCTPVYEGSNSQGEPRSCGPEFNAGSQSPSQSSSQVQSQLKLDIKPLKPKRRKRSEGAIVRETILRRRCDDDELRMMREAFVVHYPPPPSNQAAHGRYEAFYGREMTEEMEDELWETVLKPWSDRWWQLYTDFGLHCRAEKMKKPLDRSTKMTVAECKRWSKIFYKENGDARAPGIEDVNGENNFIARLDAKYHGKRSTTGGGVAQTTAGPAANPADLGAGSAAQAGREDETGADDREQPVAQQSTQEEFGGVAAGGQDGACEEGEVGAGGDQELPLLLLSTQEETDGGGVGDDDLDESDAAAAL